jgi:hypothetical protein
MSGSESELKGNGVAFGHERLHVYRAAIDYVGWADQFYEEIKGQRGYAIHEEADEYLVSQAEADTDSEPAPTPKEA